MNPILTERIEGGVFLIFAVWIYSAMGASWWLFAALILMPDISMLAYYKGARWGAGAYNVVHTYTLPLLLGVVGYVANDAYMMAVAVIWVTHIAADRALGYGLKLETGFRDTHLGRIGKSPV